MCVRLWLIFYISYARLSSIGSHFILFCVYFVIYLFFFSHLGFEISHGLWAECHFFLGLTAAPVHGCLSYFYCCSNVAPLFRPNEATSLVSGANKSCNKPTVFFLSNPHMGIFHFQGLLFRLSDFLNLPVDRLGNWWIDIPPPIPFNMN